jgi:hypothetical protein
MNDEMRNVGVRGMERSLRKGRRDCMEQSSGEVDLSAGQEDPHLLGNSEDHYS